MRFCIAQSVAGVSVLRSIKMMRRTLSGTSETYRNRPGIDLASQIAIAEPQSVASLF